MSENKNSFHLQFVGIKKLVCSKRFFNDRKLSNIRWWYPEHTKSRKQAFLLELKMYFEVIAQIWNVTSKLIGSPKMTSQTCLNQDLPCNSFQYLQ